MSAESPDHLSVDAPARDRIARVIRDYDAQGDHRTGSPADEASGRWLADEVLDLGVEPTLEWFPFRQTEVAAAYVELAGERVEGLPLFDGGFTGSAGLTGPLGPLGTDADVAVVRLPPTAGSRLADLRRSCSHRALVVVTGNELSGSPLGLVPYNAETAESYETPQGPPVLQVGREDGSIVERWAKERATVRLVACASRKSTAVFNVTAFVEGTKPRELPLIVMTPRSGWWRCAAERGGGLAIWLEMIRSFARERPERDVRFVASTGHELGHCGLVRFLREHASSVRESRLWIHLGANLGAGAGEPGTTLQSSEEDVRVVAFEALGKAGVPMASAPPGARPLGEAREIHDRGGRYLSLLGGNDLFHSPRDRWPEAVDLAAVVRLAGAVVELGRLCSRAPSL